MDTLKIIKDLQAQRDVIDQAIAALSRLASGQKRRGRPPAFLKNLEAPKRRGRPPKAAK